MRHLILEGGELQVTKEGVALADTELVDLGQSLAADTVEKRIRLETGTMTDLARKVATVASEEHAHVHLVGLGLQPAKPTAHAVVVAVSLNDQSPLFLTEVLPGDSSRNPLLLAEGKQLAPFPLRGFDTPGFERAVFDREQRVRHDQVEVEVDGATEPTATVARSQRAVEREQVGYRFLVGNATRGAF